MHLNALNVYRSVAMISQDKRDNCFVLFTCALLLRFDVILTLLSHEHTFMLLLFVIAFHFSRRKKNRN